MLCFLGPENIESKNPGPHHVNGCQTVGSVGGFLLLNIRWNIFNVEKKAWNSNAERAVNYTYQNMP